jgi:predicted transcriptional regulator/transcriptional regulator with XRE-family HTH domain
MTSETNLGTRLRTLRRRANIPQARLAKQLGISASYLNLIESNQRKFPAELMFRAADELGLDVRVFASGGADEQVELQVLEALSAPMFDDADIKASDVREVAANHPAIAKAIVKLASQLEASQEALEKLGGMVLDSKARQEWRFGDVEQLHDLAATRLPSEEVNDLVQSRANYFPELEDLADATRQRHRMRSDLTYEGLVRAMEADWGVEVRIAKASSSQDLVRRYDAGARVLWISETLAPRSRHFHIAHQLGLFATREVGEHLLADASLTRDESRTLGRMVLASYFAGALLMPYEAFYEAAESERYDVELLGHRFRTSFEQVAHRLTSLRRRGQEGVAFHFVKTDTAGNVAKRFSASGIQFARFSGGCPRWNVNQAFLAPGRISIQVSEMPDLERYFCIARTVHKRYGGHRSAETVTAVCLGCKLSDAPRLVYSDGIDLDRVDVVPIGTNCRVCDRLGCAHRAFPSLRHRLALDENTRLVAFYGMAPTEP